MKKYHFILSLVFTIVPSMAVLAHEGGLDSSGCHNDRKKSEYHCHNGPLSGESFNSKGDAFESLQKQGAKEEKRVAEQLIGVASVIDGDTIEIHGQRIRFHGVDAPESAQLCKSDEGKEYRCGQQAALALSDMIGKKTVACDQKDIDRYKRIVAVCSVGNIDLNAKMVELGYALAYRQYSKDYIPQEEKAKSLKAGIWQGSFDNPWEWRKQKKK